MLITGGSTHQTSRCVILLSRTRFKRIRHSVALRPSDISQSAMYYDVLINDLAYVYRQLNGGLLNVFWNFDVFVFTLIGETCLWLEQTRNRIENFETKEDQMYANCFDVWYIFLPTNIDSCVRNLNYKLILCVCVCVFFSLSPIKTNRKINQIRFQWLQHNPTVFSILTKAGSQFKLRPSYWLSWLVCWIEVLSFISVPTWISR